ncbi:MAG: YeeE/YedE thiosulfate transporter family protein [Eubacteriales bacterium]|nr:YeeE/YedE thiosulfate transporter family protein [Eubacteriales bacterium]
MVVAILLGIFFGFALYFVGAGNNATVLDMLRLRNMRLGKIIFFAIGLAAFLAGLAASLGLLSIDHFKIKPLHAGVIIGALIFGVGFGLIGRCPGTCPVAMGAGTIRRGLVAILGGLLGALCYSLVYGSIAATGLFEQLNAGAITLFQVKDGLPSLLAIPHWGLALMGGLFMGAAYLMPMEIRKPRR